MKRLQENLKLRNDPLLPIMIDQPSDLLKMSHAFARKRVASFALVKKLV